MSSARRAAIDALVRVERGGFANLVLPEMLRTTRLPARDRAFATELVYGTQREIRAIDEVIAGVASRSIPSLDPVVRAALRVGVYQLIHGVPAHAAIGETVGALEMRVRGFANGVLRAVTRSGYPDSASRDYIRACYPDWIIAETERSLGVPRAHAVLTTMNDAPSLTLRVNPRRATVDSVRAELQRAAVTDGRLVPNALRVIGAGDPQRLPAVREGRATPQDEASQAVAAYVARDFGRRILDMAAAPGGKATAIAELRGDQSLVVAADSRAARLNQVTIAAQRLGLPSVVAVVADGRAAPFADAAFDTVLLDAPCSGLGALHRRPDARERITKAQISELATLQRALLDEAARLVAPGGRLVYSVCTYTRLETSAIDAYLADALADWTVSPPPGAPWRPLGRGALITPDDCGTDGMFVLGLRKPDHLPADGPIASQ